MHQIWNRTARLTAVLAAGVLTAMALPAAADTAPAAGAARNDLPGNSWASIARLPDWSGIWELDWEHNRALMRPSPPKLTPAAQARYDAYKKAQVKGEDLQPQQANCLPPGMPQIMTQPYPIEFLYAPGKVVMIVEAYSQWRNVFTDGRPHQSDPDPSFQGDSIGHWEGDTLVVDTVGFVPFSNIMPGIGHSDQMHIVERIRRIDPRFIQITTTITDPKVLAEPWTQVRVYRKDPGDLREYECEQNNRDSADSEGRPGERIGESK